MVVAIDVGEADDIHPTNKSTVARRLARWALADVYRKLTLAAGPQIASASLGEHTITLTFDRVGGGLRAFDGEALQGFAVEADNGNFVNVPARIKGKNEVLLSTKGIKDPKRVQYAWHTNPATANLSNEQRQPASPFEITLDQQVLPSSTDRQPTRAPQL